MGIELKFLNQSSLAEVKSFSFLFYRFREERIVLSIKESRILHSICYDLLILDFIQCLASHGIEEPLNEINCDNNSIGKLILTDHVNYLALTLGLQNFTRIQFMLNWGQLELTLKIYEPHKKIEITEVDGLIEDYINFIQYSMNNGIFYLLFSSPYNSKLILSKQLEPLWVEFLNRLSIVINKFQVYFSSISVNKFFAYWLRRVHQASTWGQEFDNLKSTSEKCWLYDDPENNRIYTHTDYFGSILGAQYLREYSEFIRLPVFKRKQHIENRYSHLEHIDQLIYNKMAKCIVAASDSNYGEYITKISNGTGSYDDQKILKTFNFLKHFSSSHFMGHIGELFALSLVNFQIRRLNTKIICIPGSSILIKNKNGVKQGPDGLIATVVYINDKFHLKIFGIIEIKSYRVSPKIFLNQFTNHLDRLKKNQIKLIVRKDENQIMRWAQKNEIGDEAYQISSVESIEFDDKVEFIAVIPSSFRKRVNSEISFIEMPWLPFGFQLMGYTFIYWIIENFGRIGNESNYEIGKKSWIINLERILKNDRLSNRDKQSIKLFLQFLKYGIQSPDNYWVGKLI